MLIDWFTVIAQIINFLILVALLKRFLYGPIIKAMDDREARIAEDLAAAERKRQEARQEIETYQQKNREIEEQRASLLRQAEEEAEAERKKLMRTAREEVEAARSRWQKAIEQEKTAFLQDLRHRAGRQTYAVMRRALADLANADLEQHITAVFIDRLQKLSAADLEALCSRNAQGNQSVTVQSAFELPEEARQQLRQTVQAQLENGRSVHFETNPDLICGLELKVPGHKIAWSLASYLDELEEALAEALVE